MTGDRPSDIRGTPTFVSQKGVTCASIMRTKVKSGASIKRTYMSRSCGHWPSHLFRKTTLVEKITFVQCSHHSPNGYHFLKQREWSTANFNTWYHSISSARIVYHAHAWYPLPNRHHPCPVHTDPTQRSLVCTKKTFHYVGGHYIKGQGHSLRLRVRT